MLCSYAIIFSISINEHYHPLNSVLQRFHEHGLRVKVSKCLANLTNVCQQKNDFCEL